jgi:hypothetical protein
MVKKRAKKKVPRSSLDILIFKNKAREFIKAIKEYWSQQDKLQQQFNKLSYSFGITNAKEIFPSDLSSIILLLRDGVVFMRFKIEGSKKGLQTIVNNIFLDDWSQSNLMIPIGDSVLYLPFIIKGRATFNAVDLSPIVSPFAVAAFGFARELTTWTGTIFSPGDLRQTMPGEFLALFQGVG